MKILEIFPPKYKNENVIPSYLYFTLKLLLKIITADGENVNITIYNIPYQTCKFELHLTFISFFTLMYMYLMTPEWALSIETDG